MRHLGCLSRFDETEPDLVIELVSGRYEVIGTSAQALAAAQREKLLTALSADPARLEEIAQAIGEPPASVRALLNTLHAQEAVSRHGGGRKGDPYTWSLPGGDGDDFPFVPLRGTHERKASTPDPQDEAGLAVEDDYPASAYQNEED